MSTCLEIEVSIKIKYGHDGIIIILITTTYIDFIIYVAVMRIIMMPSCPYFIFIDASTSKHEDIFIVIGFSLEDKRGLSLGELIRPFCIMLLYRYLLHYGLLFHFMSQYLWLFSLILQGLHEEGECR